MSDECRIVTTTPETTREIGQRLGAMLRGGDLIALIGNLGAGKTTLTQGIGSGLGIKSYLRSPTFTLVNEYHLPDGATLLHLDGYRLSETMDEAMLEADTFGMDQLFEDDETIVIIEWADRIAAMLPADRLEIQIAPDDEDEQVRHFVLTALGPRSLELLRRLQATL